jgi:allantoin racemase
MRRIGYYAPISGFSEAELARRRAIIARFVPSDVEVELVASAGAPTFIDQRADFGSAVSAASSFLASVDPTKYDVLISAGAIDPGLDKLRAASPLPLIGPGEAAMYVASIIGARLSIVTLDEWAVEVARTLIETLEVKPPIASIRGIDMPARQIVDDLEAARAATMREARNAVRDDGAAAIYLGAMTLGTLDVDVPLRRELVVPVLNPVQIAFGTAVQYLRTLD